MNVKPINRNLLIEIPEDEPEEQSSTFLLPQSYKKKETERFTLVRIVDISDDCEKFHQYHTGKHCVVETTMINEINIESQTYNIIAENYVVLVVNG